MYFFKFLLFHSALKCKKIEIFKYFSSLLISLKVKSIFKHSEIKENIAHFFLLYRIIHCFIKENDRKNISINTFYTFLFGINPKFAAQVF